MKIFHNLSELGGLVRPVCLAIGFFDGVHLGHQQLIRHTVTQAHQNEALAVIITFDRHPKSVVAPERSPSLILSLTERLSLFESLAVDAVLVIHFDKTFSERSGEDFVRSLLHSGAPIRSVCVGADFVFGHRRTGNVELLRRLGSELDFTVHALEPVSFASKTVSSTRIRQAIAAGNWDSASQMLGRPHSFEFAQQTASTKASRSDAA